MKNMILRLIKISLFFMYIAAPQAETELQTSRGTELLYEFPKDFEFCFAHGELRGIPTEVTLKYNYIINEEDYFKAGKVFVGFRLKSKPNQLWLFNGGGGLQHWFPYDLNKEPTIDHSAYKGTLLPLIPLTIIREPVDLSSLIGDGELLIGYGLQENENSSVDDVFKEMIEQGRFNLIWEVGSYANFPSHSANLCLNASSMTKIFFANQPNITTP